MDKKYSYVLFAVVTMWVSPIYGGEYVTYKDPKTGAIYFGDAVPTDIPKNVKVDIKRAEPVSTVGKHWTAAEKNKAELLKATTPRQAKKQEPKSSDSDLAIIRNNQKIMDQLDHTSRKPSPPGRGPVFRDFNRATNAWGKYESDMFEWRSQGRELRQKYDEPQGFGRYPTGFSQEEKLYYKSYAP